MDFGMHLPLVQLASEPLSYRRLEEAVDTARECEFAAVSANDHFLFSTPWLDGPTALASVIERSGTMTLATTVSLAVLRGPVALAKTLAAIDVLSDGRVLAALGPGSSKRDYDAVGIPFEERWKRLDEAVAMLRALLNGGERPVDPRYYPVPRDAELAPRPVDGREVPLWIGSWGSDAGLRRVARLADGWLSETLAPLLGRDPGGLGAQVCVGTAEHCAELLSQYAEAGCERVYLWPLGEERRQLELLAADVFPQVTGA